MDGEKKGCFIEFLSPHRGEKAGWGGPMLGISQEPYILAALGGDVSNKLSSYDVNVTWPWD